MTVQAERHTDSGADVSTSRWQRWSCGMQIVVTDADALPAARGEVDDELDAIEAAASRFRPDSEISSLCASGGRPTEVSELLAALLAAALEAARQTDGDVDPTVGAALIALGYDKDIAALGHIAPAEMSVSIPARWSMVTLEDRVVTVPSGVVVDLGATAKAIAADRCAARVHLATGSGVLVNLGGDIATAGSAPPGGWQVLVQDDDDEPASLVALQAGAALATSSTIRRRWRRGTVLAHHILDPRTYRPAEPVWRTVSVVTPTCLEANTVSTAAIVRGHAALDWIGALDLPARLVDRERGVHRIGGWPPDEPGVDR